LFTVLVTNQNLGYKMKKMDIEWIYWWGRLACAGGEGFCLGIFKGDCAGF
jgi:hypothetical protein